MTLRGQDIGCTSYGGESYGFSIVSRGCFDLADAMVAVELSAATRIRPVSSEECNRALGVLKKVVEICFQLCPYILCWGTVKFMMERLQIIVSQKRSSCVQFFLYK